MFATYRKERGEYPHEDHEPTPDQLAAVQQLISAEAAPYVDFSLFGPHGRRLMRKLHLVAHHYEPSDGSWRKQDLPGPPDFATWWRCWLVFRCTMILLRQAKPEPLELYGELIRDLSQNYGPSCWFLVYQADVRMRSEEMERIRRRIAIENTDPNVDLTWGTMFLAATKSKTFWDTEVREKALLYLTRVRNRTETLDDGTAAPWLSPALPAPSANNNKRWKQGKSSYDLSLIHI